MEHARKYRRRGTALAVIALSVSALVVPNSAGAMQPLPEVDCVNWTVRCSPQKAVQVVTYNVREGFGGPDQMFPDTCPQAKGSDPGWVPGDVNQMRQCTEDSRNTATRVAAVAGGNGTPVPDVVLLQETTGDAARRFAQYLGWRYADRYDFQAIATPPPNTTSICELPETVPPTEPDPTCVEKATFEANNEHDVKAERDTAIVINATTMTVLSTKWITHKQQVDEVPPVDADADPEYVRWRYTPVAHLMKRNGSWTLVTASMHWTALHQFDGYASAERARTRWATEVAAAVDGAYPLSPQIRIVGGDLNAYRCVDTTPWPPHPIGDPPPVDDANCVPRTAWYQTLQDQNFRDAGHVARVNGVVENTSPGERIDYIWARKVFCSSKTDSGYSWMPEASQDPPDGQPTDFASDHRALRAMFAYEAGGCS